MTLSELLNFLNSIGTSPKKGLSQNFLIDQNIVRKIVQTAGVQKGDIVLEIGPGPGALTALLLEAGATVYAIEKDPVLADALSRFQTPDNRLTVFCDDALEFSFEKIPFQKVVANLPYHITTPLLEKCFNVPFASLTLMVQKEVADRIFAKNGTKDFGSLSLFAQFYAHLKNKFLVPPTCFFPKPGVDSTVIHLEKREPIANCPSSFFPLMRRSFQQRRKMLSSSLKDFAPAQKIKDSLTSLSLRSDARPEMLSLDEWISFASALSV